MKYCILTLCCFVLFACQAQHDHADAMTDEAVIAKQEKARAMVRSERAYFASGCFWCVEAVFESVEGVVETISGYSGGTEENPTYKQVAGGRTSHAEAVEVIYDPSVVDFKTLVTVYYASHDPTQVLGQGPDRGSQYRSIAFYQSDAEKQIIEDYIQSLYQEGDYEKGEIVTEITAFEKFWDAEDYHQDFERRNPTQGYVKAVSIPRLLRFQKKHPELLKDRH